MKRRALLDLTAGIAIGIFAVAYVALVVIIILPAYPWK